MAQNFFWAILFETLVRLAGIEPTTPWFVAKYSIQLSYSRQDIDYSLEISCSREKPILLFDPSVQPAGSSGKGNTCLQ